MRKRRRLADKLTIMVCAVLVAVSAFFYAPMFVSAEEVLTGTTNVSMSADSFHYQGLAPISLGVYNFGNSLDDDSYYEVTFDSTVYFSSTIPIRLRHYFVRLNVGDSPYIVNFKMFDSSVAGELTYFPPFTERHSVIGLGSDLKNVFIEAEGVLLRSSNGVGSISGYFSFDNISVSEISSSNSDDYQNGYNAGYSAGEQAGYGNGYSQGFTDGEASVDTNEIYNQGFNAGKESVDTQSYYDAGYQAGYQVAFQDGYDSGYDVGYQSAMDRIDSWGADTSDYPILVYDNSVSRPSVLVECFSNSPGTSYGMTSLFHLDFNVNPNHTYKFVFDSDGFYSDSNNCLYSSDNLSYVVGDFRYSARYDISWGTNTVFIPGSFVGSVVNLDAFVYEMRYYGGVSEPEDFYLGIGTVRIGTHGDVSLKVYDMGPSGDTQNHIANQTDQLTGGYNDSQGNSVNNDFSAGLNDFETAEDSLFATATTGLKDFTFFDIQSVPAMVTGMSFVGSIMSGWFSQAGGASGVGIVLSILFSIMLVAMVLGLYRWYQSKGGKD